MKIYPITNRLPTTELDPAGFQPSHSSEPPERSS
jgi:hypothetical protein